MTINYFSVNNFRGVTGGLEKNRIQFGETNTLFILGQNNVGKSTFLNAYEFFYSDKSPVKDDFNCRDDSREMCFEMEVILDQYDLKRIATAAPKQRQTFPNYLKNDSTLRIQRSYETVDGKMKTTNRTWNPGTGGWESVGYGSIGLHQVFQSCMPRPIFIKAMPTEEEVKNNLNDILKSIAESKLRQEELEELRDARERIQRLQAKMYDPKTIAEYEDSVNAYFRNLFPDTRIMFKDVKSRVVWSENKLGKDYDIEFKRSGEDGDVDETVPTSVHAIGHGAVRTAIFTLLLMRDVAEEFERKPGRKDYIVLFEEPELFLYPGIIRELRGLIYQVSEDALPYQVLCASHSPEMIDISRPKSSIIRITKDLNGTALHQVTDEFLKEATATKSDEELRQEMYEVLRFNPYICETFYADEVILVEGSTEEIIVRAFLQEGATRKNVFVLNCGSVTNIPFYQKVFSQFAIKYHVICDTDGVEVVGRDASGNPIFNRGIQGTISKQFEADRTKSSDPNDGILRVHDTTFEPAHQIASIPAELRYVEETALGKPYNANLYWKKRIKPNLGDNRVLALPLIGYLKEIVSAI